MAIESNLGPIDRIKIKEVDPLDCQQKGEEKKRRED